MCSPDGISVSPGRTRGSTPRSAPRERRRVSVQDLPNRGIASGSGAAGKGSEVEPARGRERRSSAASLLFKGGSISPRPAAARLARPSGFSGAGAVAGADIHSPPASRVHHASGSPVKGKSISPPPIPGRGAAARSAVVESGNASPSSTGLSATSRSSTGKTFYSKAGDLINKAGASARSRARPRQPSDSSLRGSSPSPVRRTPSTSTGTGPQVKTATRKSSTPSFAGLRKSSQTRTRSPGTSTQRPAKDGVRSSFMNTANLTNKARRRPSDGAQEAGVQAKRAEGESETSESAGDGGAGGSRLRFGDRLASLKSCSRTASAVAGAVAASAATAVTTFAASAKTNTLESARTQMTGRRRSSNTLSRTPSLDSSNRLSPGVQTSAAAESDLATELATAMMTSPTLAVAPSASVHITDTASATSIAPDSCHRTPAPTSNRRRPTSAPKASGTNTRGHNDPSRMSRMSFDSAHQRRIQRSTSMQTSDTGGKVVIRDHPTRPQRRSSDGNLAGRDRRARGSSISGCSPKRSPRVLRSPPPRGLQRNVARRGSMSPQPRSPRLRRLHRTSSGSRMVPTTRSGSSSSSSKQNNIGSALVHGGTAGGVAVNVGLDSEIDIAAAAARAEEARIQRRLKRFRDMAEFAAGTVRTTTGAATARN